MDLDSLIKRLEHERSGAIESFENNNMKFNQDKCLFPLTTCHLSLLDIKIKMLGLIQGSAKFGKVIGRTC